MQVLGLASGLDVQSLIDQLLLIERQPITTLSTKNSTYQSKLSVWSDIKTRLLTLNEKIKDLQVQANFASKAAGSSQDDIAAVSAQSTAMEGVYHLHVTSLATSTKVESGSRIGQGIDPSAVLRDSGIGTVITAGDFSINGKSISVDPGTESLNDILAKTNDPVNGVPGVTATYNLETDRVTLSSSSNIQLGSGADTGNFLSALWLDGQTGTEITGTVSLGGVKENVILESARFKNPLTPTTAGAFIINGITINFDTGKDTLNSIIARINSSDANVSAAYDPLRDTITLTAKYTGSKIIQMEDISGNFLTAAGLLGTAQNLGANALYSIEEVNGGSPLTGSSNQIDNVIPGVSFSLKGNGDTVLTVENDPDVTITNIKAFVEQYNNVMGLVGSKLGKDQILQGDSSLQRLQYNLRTKTTGQIFDTTNDLNLISQIGIKIDSAGVMTLDENKLKDVLGSNPDGVYSLFNTTDGIATRLKTEIEAWTLSSNGIIPARENSINRQLETNRKTIETMETRLEQRRQQLVRQFTIMEKALASLTSQSDWLAGQLSSLPGLQQSESS